MAIKLFGFTISSPFEKKTENNPSFTPPANDDGALIMPQQPHYGSYLDLNGVARNERELITRYREMAMQPEVDSAIDDIVNEVIVSDQNGNHIKINLDGVDQPKSIKKLIEQEFDTILKLLNYKNLAYDIYRKFYVDGRMYWHIIIDNNHPDRGIRELRYIDSRKMKLVKDATVTKDPQTGVDVISIPNEYFVYSKFGIEGNGNITPQRADIASEKITKDSIIYFTSGLVDAKRGMVLGRLHKGIKVLNQLRMIEDAIVIYRISRAPERRVFYVNVGGMNKPEAEKYLRDIMIKYKNKVVYNIETGQVGDERRFMSMMDDFWIPRRSDGDAATKIEQLPGGDSLKNIDDIEYFEKKLYKALNVPYSRMDSADGFNLGRSTEISRDEIKFSKFIERERVRFSQLFLQALRVQCALKGICTKAEFDSFKDDIQFDYIKDNHYAELKEAELLTNRINVLTAVEPYRGTYFSKEYIFKNILRMNDEEIEKMNRQIEEDRKTQNDVPTATINNARQQEILNRVGLQQAQASHDQQMQFQQQDMALQQQMQAQMPQEQQQGQDVQQQGQQAQGGGNNPSGSNLKNVEPREVPSIKKIVSQDK